MSSDGAKIQLVAAGDGRLTKNAEVTFFRSMHKRHTNFAIESIPQLFNGDASAGGRLTATVARKGDLAHRIWLELVVPAAAAARPSGILYDLIEAVSVDIGGKTIDRHSGAWLKTWHELSNAPPQQEALRAMSGWPAAGSGSATPESIARVPLAFWFCKEIGQALPLVALQYHDVKIVLERSRVPLPSGGASLRLWVDYVYLATAERRRFAKSKHTYLIEQVQSTGQERLTASGGHTRIPLDFNHPVKELVWVTRNSAGARVAGTVSTRLQLNGRERFPERDGGYFSTVQRLQHHTGTLVDRVAPAEVEPSVARSDVLGGGAAFGPTLRLEWAAGGYNPWFPSSRWSLRAPLATAGTSAAAKYPTNLAAAKIIGLRDYVVGGGGSRVVLAAPLAGASSVADAAVDVFRRIGAHLLNRPGAFVQSPYLRRSPTNADYVHDGSSPQLGFVWTRPYSADPAKTPDGGTVKHYGGEDTKYVGVSIATPLDDVSPTEIHIPMHKLPYKYRPKDGGTVASEDAEDHLVHTRVYSALLPPHVDLHTVKLEVRGPQSDRYYALVLSHRIHRGVGYDRLPVDASVRGDRVATFLLPTATDKSLLPPTLSHAQVFAALRLLVGAKLRVIYPASRYVPPEALRHHSVGPVVTVAALDTTAGTVTFDASGPALGSVGSLVGFEPVSGLSPTFDWPRQGLPHSTPVEEPAATVQLCSRAHYRLESSRADQAVIRPDGAVRTVTFVDDVLNRFRWGAAYTSGGREALAKGMGLFVGSTLYWSKVTQKDGKVLRPDRSTYTWRRADVYAIVEIADDGVVTIERSLRAVPGIVPDSAVEFVHGNLALDVATEHDLEIVARFTASPGDSSSGTARPVAGFADAVDPAKHQPSLYAARATAAFDTAGLGSGGGGGGDPAVAALGGSYGVTFSGLPYSESLASAAVHLELAGPASKKIHLVVRSDGVAYDGSEPATRRTEHTITASESAPYGVRLRGGYLEAHAVVAGKETLLLSERYDSHRSPKLTVRFAGHGPDARNGAVSLAALAAPVALALAPMAGGFTHRAPAAAEASATKQSSFRTKSGPGTFAAALLQGWEISTPGAPGGPYYPPGTVVASAQALDKTRVPAAAADGNEFVSGIVPGGTAPVVQPLAEAAEDGTLVLRPSHFALRSSPPGTAVVVQVSRILGLAVTAGSGSAVTTGLGSKEAVVVSSGNPPVLYVRKAAGGAAAVGDFFEWEVVPKFGTPALMAYRGVLERTATQDVAAGTRFVLRTKERASQPANADGAYVWAPVATDDDPAGAGATLRHGDSTFRVKAAYGRDRPGFTAAVHATTVVQEDPSRRPKDGLEAHLVAPGMPVWGRYTQPNTTIRAVAGPAITLAKPLTGEFNYNDVTRGHTTVGPLEDTLLEYQLHSQFIMHFTNAADSTTLQWTKQASDPEWLPDMALEGSRVQFTPHATSGTGVEHGGDAYTWSVVPGDSAPVLAHSSPGMWFAHPTIETAIIAATDLAAKTITLDSAHGIDLGNLDPDGRHSRVGRALAITLPILTPTDRIVVPGFTVTDDRMRAFGDVVLSAEIPTYVYSFASSPEELQPTGSCNFSRITHADLLLRSTADAATATVYATNYNALTIRKGMGGLRFSN